MTAQDGKKPATGRRRALMLAGGVAGAAAAYGVATQLRHPTKSHREPDGRFRTLTLHWPHADRDPVLIVARERGFFANYSLDVKTPGETPTGNSAISEVAQDRAVGAVAPALSWLPRLHDGTPAKLVAGLTAGSFRVLVRVKSGVTRLESIVGKTIATTDEDSADRRFFSVLLRRKGIDADRSVNWTLLPMNEVSGALASGDIDGIVAHDPFAWTLLTAPGAGLKELAGSTTGLYAERVNLVLGLTDEFLDSDPDGSVALTLALRDTCRWIAAHTDEVSTLLSHHLTDMDDDAVDAMLAHEPRPVHLLGRWLRDQMAQYADELKLIGRLPDALDSGAFAKSICRNVLHV
ncbi:ABC transporter substrate-binding protein [Acetobacter sp. DsW_063]|uniref:ABC transporter substrate-binding protein n=1 Tax=Acetobacter sp. DsW_063 TaxID=1514894 RepID=UPI000A37B653|nr:ABC transporter substrate-binding protein [Acetobacter sp. DsW_063]OUJ12674.1 hypothetical protein HK28_03140 [Acetobacter sp. DsW_063]